MKKLISLMVALILLLTAVNVFAEEVETDPPLLLGPQFTEEVTETVLIPNPNNRPSISSDDLIEVVVTNEENVNILFYVKDEINQADWYKEELARIEAHVLAGNTVMSYLPAEIAAEAMTQFAKGTDQDSIVCYEIEAPGAHNYKIEYGDLFAKAVLPTQYPKDVDVVAIVGIHEGTLEDGTNIIKWYVLETSVNEDGTLTVLFPQEVITRLQDEGHGIMLSVSMPIVTE